VLRRHGHCCWGVPLVELGDCFRRGRGTQRVASRTAAASPRIMPLLACSRAGGSLHGPTTPRRQSAARGTAARNAGQRRCAHGATDDVTVGGSPKRPSSAPSRIRCSEVT